VTATNKRTKDKKDIFKFLIASYNPETYSERAEQWRLLQIISYKQQGEGARIE
jgi:hypothetical protein